MATWSNANKSASPAWSNTTRNSATFAGVSKSGAGLTYGDLSNDQIGAMTNDDIFLGRPIDDWKNDDPVGGTFWANSTRN